MPLRRLPAVLVLLAAAVAARAADVERAAVPELAPSVVAAPALSAPSVSEATLLWNAASLPPIDLASWQRLQQGDAAAVHAGAVLLQKLERAA